ncbi:MAG: FHA domain-containing protein [bacterium]|nr:FHA domain-containing protein [bacterium]
MSLNWLDDPYSEFLDLPAGERPPHHYQLLEVEIFCAQRERIEHAVRKQFRRIKPYQEHPDVKMREAIQDVMTQIAQARVVLGDPARKEVYDRELAERLEIDRARILASRMAIPVPEFAVVVTAGPSHVGNTIELSTDTTVSIGRDPHCVIPLQATRLGTLHGELHFRDAHWWYAHVAKGSLSLVNAERVAGPRPLKDGDCLELGGYALRFQRTERLHQLDTAVHPPLRLIVTRGPSVPEAACNALAPGPILIGSGETALWQLSGGQVSRHHCRIEVEADRWVVSDLQSTSGTLLNGHRVEHQPLADHDTLGIGSFEVTVRLRP